jgi:hypothetical protein
MQENDKSKIKTAIIILAVSIILLLVNKIMSYEGGNKGKLEKQMYYIGAVYYEEGLYELYKDDQSTLKEYENNGYTISLGAAMEDIKHETDVFKNHKTKNECDMDNSTIEIRPKSPYGKKDYEIKTNLVCGY